MIRCCTFRRTPTKAHHPLLTYTLAFGAAIPFLVPCNPASVCLSRPFFPLLFNEKKRNPFSTFLVHNTCPTLLRPNFFIFPPFASRRTLFFNLPPESPTIGLHPTTDNRNTLGSQLMD